MHWIWFCTAALLAVTGFTLIHTATLGKAIMSVQAQVDALVAQLGKAKTEIVDKLADLTLALDDAGVAEEVDLTELAAAVQALDNVVPDPIVELPAEVVEELPAEVVGEPTE